MLDANYQLHRDAQQTLILRLMREVQQLGARFAIRVSVADAAVGPRRAGRCPELSDCL